MFDIETIRRLNDTKVLRGKSDAEPDELSREYSKEELRELRAEYRHDLAAFPRL